MRGCHVGFVGKVQACGKACAEIRLQRRNGRRVTGNMPLRHAAVLFQVRPVA